MRQLAILTIAAPLLASCQSAVRPDAEGSAYSDGANAQGLLSYVARQREVDGFIEGGETVPAVRAALSSGASVWGGEPDDTEVRDRVLSMGFSADDVLGFYVLRMIPQWIVQRSDWRMPGCRIRMLGGAGT